MPDFSQVHFGVGYPPRRLDRLGQSHVPSKRYILERNADRLDTFSKHPSTAFALTLKIFPAISTSLITHYPTLYRFPTLKCHDPKAFRATLAR